MNVVFYGTLSIMVQHRAAFTRRLRELLDDDTGQDLIEYAILTALIAAGSVLLFSALAVLMRDSYQNGWNQTAQDEWEPCPPGGCP